MSNIKKREEKQKEYMKKYIQKNKEKLKQKRRIYTNKPDIRKKINLQKRNWYQKNKNKLLNISKEYYKKNKIRLKEYKKEWYLKNKQKILLNRKKYYAIPKKKEKHLQNCQKYNKNNRKKINEIKRKYRQTEKGKLIEQNHWLKRRKQIKNTKNMLTTKELSQIKQEYTNCFYCGSKKELTIEHIKPLIKNGEHSKKNVVMACRQCNLSKNSTLLKEWLKKPYCKEKNINLKTIDKRIVKMIS